MPKLKTLGIWVFLIVAFVVLLNWNNPAASSRRTSLRSLEDALDNYDVATYSFDARGVVFSRRSDGEQYWTPMDFDGGMTQDFAQSLRESGAEFASQAPSAAS